MNGYLFAGYTAIWTLLFFFLLHLLGRQKRVESELEALEKKLKAGSSSGGE